MGFVRALKRDQSGVVESGLVIIPLIVLFLVVTQLIIAVNMRNIDLAFAQSRASSVAIGAPPRNDDEIVEFSSDHSRRGLLLVVTQMRRQIPDLLVGLLTFMRGPMRSTHVSGIAVMEEAD